MISRFQKAARATQSATRIQQGFLKSIAQGAQPPRPRGLCSWLFLYQSGTCA